RSRGGLREEIGEECAVAILFPGGNNRRRSQGGYYRYGLIPISNTLRLGVAPQRVSAPPRRRMIAGGESAEKKRQEKGQGSDSALGSGQFLSPFLSGSATGHVGMFGGKTRMKVFWSW